MLVRCLKTLTIPALAVVVLSACQAPGYRQNAYQGYAAAPVPCADMQTGAIVDCYQPTVSYQRAERVARYRTPPATRYVAPPRAYAAAPDCDLYPRPARSSYRYAQASNPCVVAMPSAAYGYAAPQAPGYCEAPNVRSYRRARPAYSSYRSVYETRRPPRYRAARYRSSSRRLYSDNCCY